MAVSLHIIKLTRQIDEGDHRAYEQLKALAKVDPDAKRVLSTVKEPPKAPAKEIKVAPPPKVDSHEDTVDKARGGDKASISQLRKRAEYEDAAAQCELGLILFDSDPAEARKWLTRSYKDPRSKEALRRMANSGDADAMRFLEEHAVESNVPRSPSRMPDPDAPVRDDLGYVRPPTRHNRCRIGDVYRINDTKLQTGMRNSTVLIKEVRGDFITALTVTKEPGKAECVRLMDPSLAGFASSYVYVLTAVPKVYKKDGLAEYRGTLSDRDAKQLRLSV